jgi:hypothetical protein
VTVSLTFGTAAAALLAAVGITGLINGLREALIDEVLFGTALLLTSWYVLTLGTVF